MSHAKGLIILGAPGSGKGTQAQLLSEQLALPHISTGEMLREAITKKTELGKKAQFYVDKGELVPDDLLLNLIGERLNQNDIQSGWILDGFPRNVAQATFLDKLLLKLGRFSEQIINLEVSDKQLVKRLLLRGRNDDNEETIRRRLEVYQEKTRPVIDYYQQDSRLTSVDGTPSLELVTASLKEIITA